MDAWLAGSSVGCTLLLGLVGLCFHLSWSPWLVVLGLCLFMFLFSLGLGAITFVVAAEVFPLSVRVSLPARALLQGSRRKEG